VRFGILRGAFFSENGGVFPDIWKKSGSYPGKRGVTVGTRLPAGLPFCEDHKAFDSPLFRMEDES